MPLDDTSGRTPGCRSASSPGAAPDPGAAIAIWSRIADTEARDAVVATLGGLLEGNRRFAAGTPASRDLHRERAALVSAQRPVAAVLACSDSRIAIEDTFDAPLGTLFGIRTAGAALDSAVLGTLEFAVTNLGIRLIVALGHENCGAVRAAVAADTPPGALGTVVGQIRGNIAGSPTFEAAIHANARATVRRMLEASAGLRSAFEGGRLAVVPAFYRLADGRVDLLG